MVGRYGLPRIYRLLDERAERIEKGLELAAKAEEGQADAEKRAERLVQEARLEAAHIRQDAQNQAKEIIAQARQAAQVDAAAIQEGASRRILAEKQAAQSPCAPTSVCSPPPWPSGSWASSCVTRT